MNLLEKRPIDREEHCQCAHVCLVGANRFQNEMFVTNMKQIYQCQNNFIVATSLSKIPETIFNKKDHKVLLCLDCFGLEIRSLERLLDSAFQIVKGSHLLILLNLTKDSGIEREALNYNVRGFFYSDDTLVDLCKGIRSVLNGEVWLSRDMASKVLLAGIQTPSHYPNAETETAHLSAREKEVLAHLSSGNTSEAIAAELCISSHTLRTHIYRIYRKINVQNRVQAARWAEKNL